MPDHFDLIARWYDRLMPPSEDDALASLLGVRPGTRVLDAGGGTGRVSARLQALGAAVVVCDYSRRMAAAASAKGLAAVRGDAARLPFDDGTVEVALVVDAFHHFNRPDAERGQRAAARELARVLSPEGRLLVEEPDIRKMPVRVVALGETLMLMRSRFLTAEALSRLFDEAGLRVEGLLTTGFSYQIILRHAKSLHDHVIEQT